MVVLMGAAKIGVVMTGGVLALLVGVGSAAAQQRQVVEMVAERFTFTPSRIEVPVGATVEIRIRSEDTDHGFHIVGGDTVIVPKRRRGEAVVVFEANEPGEYRFECSKLCGAGHNFMKGEIIVTGPDGGDGDDIGANDGAGDGAGGDDS